MFKGEKYTPEDLHARLKFVVGLVLAFTLVGIVFVVLYSLMFIEQPMSQSPNDAKFFELITPIATFLTGILSGIMLGKSPDEPKKEEKKEEPALPPPDPETPMEKMADVVDEIEDHIA